MPEGSFVDFGGMPLVRSLSPVVATGCINQVPPSATPATKTTQIMVVCQCPGRQDAVYGDAVLPCMICLTWLGLLPINYPTPSITLGVNITYISLPATLSLVANSTNELKR